MQENENNTQWQSYLDKNFKSEGTKTNLEDIKLQTKQDINPYRNIAKTNKLIKEKNENGICEECHNIIMKRLKERKNLIF